MNNNYTDLSFDKSYEYEVLTSYIENYEEYYEESNLNFFGVCSNLTYTNLDINSYDI